MSVSTLTKTGLLRTAQDEVALEGLAGLGGIAINVQGSFVGTITFEGHIGSGLWSALSVSPSEGGTADTTTTTNGLFIGSCVGLSGVRARMSSFSSGIAEVSLQSAVSAAGGSGGGGGGGGAVTIADGDDVAEGDTSDPAATDSSGSWSVVSILKGAWAKLAILSAQVLDYDTGGGTASQNIVGIALPASGGPVGVSATNPLPVTGPLTDTQLRATAVPVSGTVATGGLTDTQLRASAVPVSVATLPALPANQSVNVAQINGVTPLMGAGNTGTGSPRVTIATDQLVLPVGGNVAHDAADSGNPVKIGAKAISYGANPTAVAAADRTDLYANIAGIPFVLGGHPNVLPLLANFTSAQTNTALISVSAGTKIVVLSCTVAADHANTVDVQVRIGFATATTPTTTGVYLSHPGIAPGGGIREAGMVAGADDEDLRITCEVPTGGSIDVVMKYFTIAS